MTSDFRWQSDTLPRVRGIPLVADKPRLLMMSFNIYFQTILARAGQTLAHFHIKGRSLMVMADYPSQRSWERSLRNGYELRWEIDIVEE